MFTRWRGVIFIGDYEKRDVMSKDTEKEPQRTAGQKATHEAAVKAQAEKKPELRTETGTGKTPAQVVREGSASQVPGPNVNTALAGVPQGTTRAVVEAPVEPKADVGAAEQVTKLLNHLGAITDKAALETVRGAVNARCAQCGVPDEAKP